MKTPRLLWLVLAASCGVVTPALAQNLRQLTRATATTGVNDSALVLVSDSASRTRAALTLDLFRRPSGSATAPSNSFALSTGLGTYRFGADTLGFATGGVHSLRLSGGAFTKLVGGTTGMTIQSGTGIGINLFLAATRSSDGLACNAVSVTTSKTKLGSGCHATDSLVFTQGSAINGGAGDMTLLAGTGNSRTITLQATSSAGVVNTFAIGASDTLKAPGKAIFSALTAASGTPNSVCIDATSKQITENAATSCVVSSLRFKRDVAPLNPVTAKRIAARLRPVTYSYKDGGREAIGLIAEDAAVADGRLVSRDAQGRPHSVNYEQVTILLLSIVQQQQKQIDSLAARVTALSRRPR